MTSPLALVNSRYRESFLRIYRLIYFHFCPVTFQNPSFPADLDWIRQEAIQTIEDKPKTGNIVNLRFLNMQKRKKNDMEKTKINPRDILMSYFKNSGKCDDFIQGQIISTGKTSPKPFYCPQSPKKQLNKSKKSWLKTNSNIQKKAKAKLMGNLKFLN